MQFPCTALPVPHKLILTDTKVKYQLWFRSLSTLCSPAILNGALRENFFFTTHLTPFFYLDLINMQLYYSIIFNSNYFKTNHILWYEFVIINKVYIYKDINYMSFLPNIAFLMNIAVQ